MRLQSMSAALALALAPALAQAAPAVGDTLVCTSRHKDRQLFVVVGRITPYGEKGSVANVSLVDRAATTRLPQADHLPVDLQMVQASCPRKSATALPLGAHFEDGYAEWRQAFDAGAAGVFALSIDQIDDLLQGAEPKAAESKP